MDGESILAIPLTEPEKLFSGPSDAQAEYHALVKQWHPDVNRTPGAYKVFQHVAALWKEAEHRIKNNEWRYPGRLDFTALDGRHFRMRYLKHHPFELGDCYIGKTHVAYIISKSHEDLFKAALRIHTHFKFADGKMKQEVERYLPKVHITFETASSHVMVVEKPAEAILLADLFAHLKWSVEPKHVAWVVSTMLNLAAYFQYAKITHNALSLSTYFVLPQQHSGVLLGGWWYSRPVGSRLIALPDRAMALLPPDMLSKKTADPRLDLNLIRSVASELLGNHFSSAPKPMIQWLRYSSKGDALADYGEWRTILERSFGVRRFVKLDVRGLTDIYK